MRREISPCVYILASHRNGTLYTGVTSDLLKRIYTHREGLIAGFSRKHAVKRLLWHEAHETIESAIVREKRIKKWRRQWKVELIETMNPDWRDLAVDLGFDPLPSRRIA